MRYATAHGDARGASDAPARVYFDEISSELVSKIVTHLSYDAETKWHPVDLYHSHGALGDALQDSFTAMGLEVDLLGHFETELYDFVMLDGAQDESECIEDHSVVVLVEEQHRCYLACNPLLFATCVHVRSLVLSHEMFAASRPAIDVVDRVFAACGDVLEELIIEDCTSLSVRNIAYSIRRHCRALHTLSVPVTHLGPYVEPLICSAKGNLRKLSMWNYVPISDRLPVLPVLEELELLECDIPFIIGLKNSLRRIHFYRCPTTDELTAILEHIPHLRIGIGRMFAEDIEETIRICADRLQSFRYFENSDYCPDFDGLCKHFRNVETIMLSGYNNIHNFSEAVFSSPKPNLRELSLVGLQDFELLDFLSLNVSGLECFLCRTEQVEASYIDGFHIKKLIAANKRLKKIDIDYHRASRSESNAGNEQEEAGEIELEPEFLRCATNVVHVLKSCRFKGEISIAITTGNEDLLTSQLYEIIADACVGLRGRGVRVKVQNVVYLG